MKRKKMRKGKAGKIPPHPSKHLAVLAKASVTPLFGRRFWKYFGFCIGGIGFLASLVQLYSVFPKSPIVGDWFSDSKNPTTCQFEVFNDGMLDMHSLKIAVQFSNIEAGTQQKQIHMSNNYVSNPGPVRVDLLRAGEQVTLPLEQFLHLAAPITSAEMTMTISYRPSWCFFRVKRVQAFCLLRDASGNAHWNRRAGGQSRKDVAD
jgi:hypothetical protein